MAYPQPLAVGELAWNATSETFVFILSQAKRSYAPAMDPLHATIEEFAAEGYTHVECFCPRCRGIRLRPISWLPRISTGLTMAQLSTRLRCAECGGQLHSVKPWRLEDVLGKPLGRRG